MHINRLKAFELERLEPGLHLDGAGLYLRVGKGGNARSWIYRYRSQGRLRDVGLGSLRFVSLADARRKAHELATGRLAGKDPIAEKQAAIASAKEESGRRRTFAQVAEELIESKRPSWSSPKSEAQWASSLTQYAFPRIGKKAVAEVDVEDVLDIVQPIWTTKPETARRIRTRIENILDYAKSKKYRKGENPARWEGHLKNILPAHSSFVERKHFAALPWKDLPPFYKRLSAQDGIGADALRLAIFTTLRTNSLLGLQWHEFDEDERVLIVPKSRMKSRKHMKKQSVFVVPLSDPAFSLLSALKEQRIDSEDFVFPGRTFGKPASNMIMLATIKRMGLRGKITTHGFRSTFKDWATEETEFAWDTIEFSLAHKVGTSVEEAYRRGQMIKKRRNLMDKWGEFITSGIME